LCAGGVLKWIVIGGVLPVSALMKYET